MEGQAKKEPGQIGVQLDALDREVERLHEQIDNLLGRLGLVLRDSTETKKDVDEPQQDLVPMADRLRVYVASIERAANELQDIMARLEL